MNKLTKAYYKATAFVPRRLPYTEAEFLKFKSTILETYDFADTPANMATMVGQITCTPAHKVRKSYAHIANVMKRLTINGVAQSYRIKAIKDLESQLEILTAQEAEKAKETQAETASE